MVTRGTCTFYRSVRRKGLCLKRLRKVQGKLPFHDGHSDHHIELPILTPFQSPIETAETKKIKIIMTGKIFHCSKQGEKKDSTHIPDI